MRHLPLIVLLAAGQAASADVIATSQDGAWSFLDAAPVVDLVKPAWIRPGVAKHAVVNWARLSAVLAAAPLEGTPEAGIAPAIVTLPMPDGSFARFRVVESPVMEPELAVQFPEIKTYLGQGIDDPQASVRFDTTPQGFHSQLLSPNGAVYIDPFSRGDSSLYSVYYKRDYTKKNDGWECHTPQGARPPMLPGGIDTTNGATLRTYRLANACTGEYAAFHGGTVALAQAAIVTAINRVSGVYELDLSVRMVLVANNTSIVYTNSGTDPYTNNNGVTMLGQNQTTCDSVIGNANYDIGHVFSTGGGGVAGLRVVGVTGQKARGVTGLGSPIGDPFYIDYVAHEMGHQFGGNHTFNSPTGSCSGNRNASTAYEPGSASTIMGYAGICGADDLQPNSDPYFSFISLDEIVAWISVAPGNGNTQVATGNTWPSVSGGPDYTIPANTPFELVASGSDPNGQTPTFCWEQRNLGAAISLAAGDNGTSPIIRSLIGTVNPIRTLPRLSNLLANTTLLGERLPTTNRNLSFRVVARDNRAGGGAFNTDDVSLTVVSGAAFAVTAPNTNVSWPANSSQTVTWNVSGTNAGSINCANVAIRLSTDGGLTFPTVLLASTPNDGSQSVTIPAPASTIARIKVAAVGNIFFDVSNVNFTITAPTGPANNQCAAAITVTNGSTPFTTVAATTDGPAELLCNFCCGDAQINQDVWYTYTATCTGTATASICSATYDSKIAIYAGSGCPTVNSTAIACDDDFCGPSAGSQVTWNVTNGNIYKIRVGGFNTATGTGNLVLSCGTAACYANCDGSTIAPILNINDFTCFTNRFAAGDTYANCDGSTIAPVLNVNDFTCFLNRFAVGCT
ncbi:MAG: reprolysin-like metallopeptidase [Phycisphaerales bacterium]